LCLLAVTLALSWPAVGRADGLPTVDLSSDPWFVGWSALLPPGYLGTDTDSSDVCVAGRIACVDRVAHKLEQQVSNLGCDHNAVFSLAYARTTEKVAAVERAQPAFFSDPAWLNHYDATFSDMYFSAWNSWQRTGTAPPAWAIAFQTADRKGASAAGNLLLGMSAHVNRDLPFALYAIGLVAPDGSSPSPITMPSTRSSTWSSARSSTRSRPNTIPRCARFQDSRYRSMTFCCSSCSRSGVRKPGRTRWRWRPPPAPRPAR